MSSFISNAADAPPGFGVFQAVEDDLSIQRGIREQLQALIDDKKRQLTLVGTLGQRFLSQEVELEERIQQMDEAEIEASQSGDLEASAHIRDKLEDLARTMQTWETENQEMWAKALALGTSLANGEKPNVDPFTAPSSSFSSSLSGDMSFHPEVAPSAAQSSRRAKNAGLPRANHVGELDWYEDIGNSLTREIRRMHALLSERDKALQDLKEERDDLERSLETLRASFREQQTNAEKYREENWNLEYALQELREKLNEANASTQRAEAENKRTLKQLTSARETIDAQKNETERLQGSLDDIQSKHETDVAQMRKTTASLQREKSDLQTTLDTLKSDLAKKSRSLPNRFGSPVTPTDAAGTPGDDDDVFTGGHSTRRRYDTSSLRSPIDGTEDESWADVSPTKPSIITPSHPSTEIEALKQSLAHAHRQISTLKNSVQREKEQKQEYRRRLALKGEAPDEWEDDEDTMASPMSNRATIESPSRGLPGRRRGGRLTLAQKLGIVAAERALGSRYQTNDAEPSAVGLGGNNIDDDDEPSPFVDQKTSRPTSIDGMDPAFANVLQSLPSRESVTAIDTDETRFATFPRRARGGGAFKSEPRPPSMGDIAPTALSAELGTHGALGEGSMTTANESIYGIYSPESREIGVQVEPLPNVITTDAGVQTDEQEMVPPHSMAEVGVQHESFPALRASAAVQTQPVMVHVSTSTDPEPPRLSLGVSTDSQAVCDSSAQTISPSLGHTSTQTIPPPTVDAAIQTMGPGVQPIPVPIIVEPLHHPSETSPPATLSSSSDQVIPRAIPWSRPRPVGMIFESDSEETETEGEYVDARESEPTPSSSVQDFHSFQSAIDYADSDADSMRTSTGQTSFANALGRRSVRSRHDSQATTRATLQTPNTDTKEMSVQTDEWIPTPRPALPSAISFHRVGSTQPTQFQYVPSSPMKTTSSSVALATSISKSPVRDSIGTFGSPDRDRTLSMTSTSERSLQGEVLNKDDANPTMVSSPTIDRSRPPTMSLPPPPSMPPPPTIPTKKSSMPPPRPTSPPPPELIQRATTPTFGRQSSLLVPPNRANRPGSSIPPSQAGLRQPPSTGSFRSAANGATKSGSAFITPRTDRRDMSQTSLLSASSVPSRRLSISSSHSSAKKPITNAAPGPETPIQSAPSTDPTVIHAITQTMIGEFLYKYTRRVVGKGHGEKRHKRFFWIHPYTRTLYWSSADPGASSTGESNAKSAYIDAVKSVIDPNPMPPGLHQYSIVVYTPQREMKFTAPTKERHDIWFRALSYLIDRPSAVLVSTPAVGSMTPSPIPARTMPSSHREDGTLKGKNEAMMASPSSVRSAMSKGSMDSWNLTPRARAQAHLAPQSISRRTATPATEYLRQYSEPQYRPYPDLHSPTRSTRSLQQRFEDALDNRDDEEFETIEHQFPNTGDFEINDEPGEGFEGLENVRACCDGEHDLNDLSKGPNPHHHHHHQAAVRPSSRLSSRPDIPPTSRPVSPSAWSFRSRSGSQRSDGASLFSWGGGGDGAGKHSLRFGSRRSAKSSAPAM
ncbi:uncharacterized protein EI90DRAFT_3065826 [Cantharellus anzutake]|uniref:uncharacterized protein n=1 Tax=Cantharellus anzutake TaxID=1750568 RepID=UPI00190595A8|nr:uncharacterized protein EI90DRAFT_3065826 [Cantharellus anzutake]KAF8328184.1 hypothetical protein EI90DRAFT_3065826 [Cantharellus anzutake]